MSRENEATAVQRIGWLEAENKRLKEINTDLLEALRETSKIADWAARKITGYISELDIDTRKASLAAMRAIAKATLVLEPQVQATERR